MFSCSGINEFVLSHFGLQLLIMDPGSGSPIGGVGGFEVSLMD